MYRTDLICRIGSLEMFRDDLPHFHRLICRIGSLEKRQATGPSIRDLICRIGSLEMAKRDRAISTMCYLPHRQLRKSNEKARQ